ncbi:DUF11 domain-containing protein [Candidatus Peribacteria bacterium]|nr:DUF11 domain-containing protein [Candidatus Peribacteria bacterium]
MTLLSMRHFFSVSALLSLVCSWLLPLVPVQQALANMTVNNDTGQVHIDFTNGVGIAPDGAPLRENVTINGGGGGSITIAGGQNSGYFTTVDIAPVSFDSWGQITLGGIYPSTTSTTVSLYECTGVGDIPIAGYQNMTPVAGVVNISTLPTSTSCVRARVDMSRNGGTLAPTMTDFTLSWTPLPVLLTNITGTPTTAVGTHLNYNVQYSVSYSQDSGVVLWVPLPEAGSGIGCQTLSFNQDVTPAFVSATNGGLLNTTGGPITVAGVSVPDNAVYWNLGAIDAGITDIVSFELSTQNGWQDGICYSLTSYADSVESALAVSDSNPSTAGAQPFVSTLTSEPAPSIVKRVAGTISLDGENHVYFLPPYGPQVTYSIQIKNTGAITGREVIFDSVITDDLSDIFAQLEGSCGVSAGSAATRISGISSPGVLSGNSIVWDFTGDHLAPYATRTVNFMVDYTGCDAAPGLEVDNTAMLGGANMLPLQDSEAVVMDIPLTPSGSFAKGDEVVGVEIRAGRDDNVQPNDLTTYGDTATYFLYTQNPSTVRLDDIVMLDMVPEGETFQSASLPPLANGTVWYSTDTGATDPAIPPAYDYTQMATGTPHMGWSTTLPSPASSVTWVAFYIPCLNSPFFPAPSGDVCAMAPTSVRGTIKNTVDIPADLCSAYSILNTGNFAIYEASTSVVNADTDVSALASPITYTDDTEQTHVTPSVPTFSINSTFTGPSTLPTSTTGVYTITLKNDGTDTSVATTVTLHIPQLLVNGAMEYPSVFNVTGGTANLSQLPIDGTVTVTVGPIPAGATKTVQFSVLVPEGILVGTTLNLSAQVSATDNNACTVNPHTLTRSTALTALPELNVYKTRDEALIGSGDSIHYDIELLNVGTASSTQTVVVDRIPQYTVFETAYTTGTNANGTTYTCSGCDVFFSDGSTLPVGFGTPINPITPAQVVSLFTPGVETSPGVWGSPFGQQTRYVAWMMDTPYGTGDIFPVGAATTVGLSVRNDHDGPGPLTAGSAPGTVIYNNPLTASTELLQAIGNQVNTTILPDPGLAMQKQANTENINAGGSFAWTITFLNDSATPNTATTISDTMPYGVTVTGMDFIWNTAAVANGMSPSPIDLLTSPFVTLTPNTDGTLEIAIDVSQGLRGGDLLNQEGGTITISVTVDPSTPTLTMLTNNAVGCYENASASYCIDDSDTVTVRNPDLFLRKQVDREDPISGEGIEYTLLLSNEGLWEAPGVVVQDTLPAGVCYTSGTTAVTYPAGASLGEPDAIYQGDGVTPASATDCETMDTILVWETSLQYPGEVPNTLPANSQDMFITYDSVVQPSVPAGTLLTNSARVSTSIAEDETYPNTASAAVRPPLPDPYVVKSGPLTTTGGDSYTYSIQYGNSSRQPGHDAWVMDTLPGYNGQPGSVAVEFVSASAPQNETLYYYDQVTLGVAPLTPAPGVAPNPFFSADPGWTTSPGAYTTHIVWVPTGALLPSLYGPATVQVTVNAVDPITGVPYGGSQLFTNEAMVQTDNEDPNGQDDDVSTHTVKTPGYDLFIEKVGSSEGIYPGLTPGADLTYTITYGNSGTERICAVKITEAFPSQFVLGSPESDFTLVSLDAGALPTDLSGTPILSPVPVSFSAGTWYLGGSTGYSNVCLEPGSMGSFQIFGTVDPATPDYSVSEELILNSISITHDDPSVGPEDVTENNTASSSTVAYRADVLTTKTGTTCDTATDDCAVPEASYDAGLYTELGEYLQYTVTYNNAGNTDAEDVIITDPIPAGSCYVVGSLEADQPVGTVLEYSADDMLSWSYTPVADANGADCSVTHFRLRFLAPLTVPATYDGEDTYVDFTTQGHYAVYEDTFPIH